MDALLEAELKTGDRDCRGDAATAIRWIRRLTAPELRKFP